MLTSKFDAQMLVSLLGNASPLPGPDQKSLLQKIGLIDIFYGYRFLVDRCSQGVKADRTTAIILDNPPEQSSVDIIQSQMINIQLGESVVGNLFGDRSVSADLCKVPYPF